jgi:tetratricopeptide (TPR) repeat protein
MVHHYLELYKQSEQWKGTVVERKLIEGLDKLHRQYARAKDYDKAIRTYNLLASLDPATDSTAVVYYEYLKRANALGAEDFKGRLALARFAEQNGMDAEALEKYKSLVNYESTHDEALAGMTRYAAKQLSMAQLHFNSRNYTLAQTLADQVRKDFSYIDAVAEKAAEIIGRAEAEIAREQRQQTERAQGVLRSADEFYAQADRHFQNLFSTERRNNPYLMSDRQEALRYYQLAIGAYEEARRLNPALGQDPNSLINVRLQEAYRRIASLTQVPTGGVGRHSFQYRYNEQSGN